jgi:hypothetical protein
MAPVTTTTGTKDLVIGNLPVGITTEFPATMPGPGKTQATPSSPLVVNFNLRPDPLAH